MARARAAGQGAFPTILLISRLREHIGLGLKEAKAVVEDYGRRNELVPAYTGWLRSRWAWWVWTATMSVLLFGLGTSMVGDLCRKESWKHSHELAAVSLGLLTISVAFTGVAVYRMLRTMIPSARSAGSMLSRAPLSRVASFGQSRDLRSVSGAASARSSHSCEKVPCHPPEAKSRMWAAIGEASSTVVVASARLAR